MICTVIARISNYSGHSVLQQLKLVYQVVITKSPNCVTIPKVLFHRRSVQLMDDHTLCSADNANVPFCLRANIIYVLLPPKIVIDNQP